MISWVGGLALTPVATLLVMLGVLLLLGMFVDQISQLILTLPIFVPLAATLAFDPIWFGVVIMLGMAMSATIPPLGSVLLVVKRVGPPGIGPGRIATAAVPYLLCVVVVIAVVIAIPEIARFLPNLMG